MLEQKSRNFKRKEFYWMKKYVSVNLKVYHRGCGCLFGLNLLVQLFINRKKYSKMHSVMLYNIDATQKASFVCVIKSGTTPKNEHVSNYYLCLLQIGDLLTKLRVITV